MLQQAKHEIAHGVAAGNERSKRANGGGKQGPDGSDVLRDP